MPMSAEAVTNTLSTLTARCSVTHDRVVHVCIKDARWLLPSSLHATSADFVMLHAFR
jgi:hypothetical protein